EALAGQLEIGWIALDSDVCQAGKSSGDTGRPAAVERVEHGPTRWRRRAKNPLQQRERLLRRMPTVLLLVLRRGGAAPYGLLLLAAVLLALRLVLEVRRAPAVTRGAENPIRGVGEVAAGEGRGGIGLLPDDCLEHLEAQWLHGKAHAVDAV